MQPGQSLGFRLSISTENRAKLLPGNSILNTPIWMSFKMSEALIRRKFSSTRFVGQKNLDRDRSGRHHKKRPKLLWRLCLYIFLKLERNGTCFKSCVNGLV